MESSYAGKTNITVIAFDVIASVSENWYLWQFTADS